MSISHTDAATDTAGSTGTQGVRKARGRSGRVRRRTTTPSATTTNAKSVPMFTRAASSEMLVNPATTAMMPPSRIVERYGVPKRGCTLAKTRGSSPSRLIAKKTRVWPSSRIMHTVVSPMAAPKLMRPA